MATKKKEVHEDVGNSAVRVDDTNKAETNRQDGVDALSIEKLMNELHYELMGVTPLEQRRLRERHRAKLLSLFFKTFFPPSLSRSLCGYHHVLSVGQRPGRL